MPMFNTGSYISATRPDRTTGEFSKALSINNAAQRKSAIQKLLEKPINDKADDLSSIVRASLSKNCKFFNLHSKDRVARETHFKATMPLLDNLDTQEGRAALLKHIKNGDDFGFGRYSNCLCAFSRALEAFEKTPSQELRACANRSNTLTS